MDYMVFLTCNHSRCFLQSFLCVTLDQLQCGMGEVLRFVIYFTELENGETV